MEAHVPQLPAPFPRHGTQGLPPRALPPCAYGALTLCGAPFQGTSASAARGWGGPCNTTSPGPFGSGFGLPSAVFGRPYSRHPILVSFPPGNKMFQFPGFPLPTERTGSTPVQEAPFGNPRINGSMRLPEAYRGLARPSSAPEPSHPPTGVWRPSGFRSASPASPSLGDSAPSPGRGPPPRVHARFAIQGPHL